MHKLVSATALAIAILFALPAARAQASSHSNSLVIVFKDGHRQSINLDSVQRLEFPGAVPAGLISVPGPSRAHFLGKWEVGEGNGENFYITLNDDGTAQRTMNDLEHERGTWVYAHGEARSPGPTAGRTASARSAPGTRSTPTTKARPSPTTLTTSPTPATSRRIPTAWIKERRIVQVSSAHAAERLSLPDQKR